MSADEGPTRVNDQDALRQTVLSAVVDAYYPDRVRLGTSARARAQAAQSVVTVFAGGLVATFILTTLIDQSTLARTFGCLAVGFWFAAAAGYVIAIALPVPPPAGLDQADDAHALIRIVLDRAREETARIDARQRWANGLAAAALVTTALTVIAVILPGVSSEAVEGTIVVDPKQDTVLPTSCKSRTSVTGKVEKVSLSKTFVVIKVQGSQCSDGNGTTLHIPAKFITLIALDDK